MPKVRVGVVVVDVNGRKQAMVLPPTGQVYIEWSIPTTRLSATCPR